MSRVENAADALVPGQSSRSGSATGDDRGRTGSGASVRQADWRFLLPRPVGSQFQHLVLLGGSEGLAERVMELGVARRVSRELPPTRSADAVVALHDAGVSPRAAAASLVTGGTLYYEIDRRSRRSLAGTPGRVRRELRNAGLSPTGSYAVLPGFSNVQLFLPLDAPGALRWYMTSVYRHVRPRSWLVEIALRATTGFDGARFAALVRCRAVTAVAGPAGSSAPSMLTHPALPAELRAADLRPLMFTDKDNRVVMLPFALDGTEPAAVLKIPKLPAFNARTQNEQARLAEIRLRLDPALRRAIPCPFGLLADGEITGCAESYMPGLLLTRSSGRFGVSRARQLADLRLAATWLGEFHAQTGIGRPLWGAPELARWIDEPFEAYGAAFGTTAGEQRLFAATRDYAAALAGVPLPVVWQHRDFNVWNLVRSGEELSVLDWEGARIGPAGCDLLHFMTHWNETARHAHDARAALRCFRELFLEPNLGDAIVDASERAIARYAQRIDMDRRLLPMLLVCTWVELALRRLDQQRAQDADFPDPRADNRSFPFIDLLAQHTDRLFGRGPSVLVVDPSRTE